MPANPYNGFTEYGIGIGLRVPHYRHIKANKFRDQQLAATTETAG